MQKRKISPDMIRVLVDEGLSAQEIADRVGWSVGTLRVRCSQLKISLRRSGKSKSHMCLAVPKAIFVQLQHHATLMGISESELATAVLSENHIRTYWWCSPARTGIAVIVPNR